MTTRTPEEQLKGELDIEALIKTHGQPWRGRLEGKFRKPHGREVYRQLNEARREIRLLTLNGTSWCGWLTSGSSADAISCNPQTVSLDDQDRPTFDALSYCFGDSEPLRLTWVDGQPYPVFPNLYNALPALRKAGQSLPLWVDAICINQNDNEEKNNQVMLMQDIFSSAT